MSHCTYGFSLMQTFHVLNSNYTVKLSKSLSAEHLYPRLDGPEL